HKSPLEELKERVCTGAAFDSAERGQPPRCHQGTRQAILSGFDTWIGDPTSPILFKWITGWPGTGKSAIAQTVAEACARKKRLAASFFFFRHHSSDDYVVDKFVTTVAWQIMQLVSGAREIILQLIANDPLVFEKSFDGMWQALVVDILVQLASSSPPMVLIVDGVDECTDHHQRAKLLLTLFHSARQLAPTFKLIITSRPELRIQNVFDAIQFGGVDQIGLGNSAEDKADIEEFLRHSFRSIRADCGPVAMLLPDTWPPENSIRRLVERACGQFIYASLVISFVRGGNDDPRFRLDLVMEDCLKSFEELDSLYLVVMKDIQKSIHPEQQCWLDYLLMCLIVFPAEFGEYKPEEFNQTTQAFLYGKLYPVVDITNPQVPKLYQIPDPTISSSPIYNYCTPRLYTSFQSGPLLSWDLHKPTHQLIFFLAKMPHRIPVEQYLRYNNCFLRWLTDSNTRRLNLLWQLPLFGVVGLPYYAVCTIKQTSSSFYRFRTHDLVIGSHYQEEQDLIYNLPPEFFTSLHFTPKYQPGVMVAIPPISAAYSHCQNMSEVLTMSYPRNIV
ncbi:hypothetical protein BDN72DRAFT_866205, partial [Pluteus cervinus]